MVFSIKKEKINPFKYLPLILSIFIITVFCISTGKMAEDNTRRDKDVLERALNRGITQCYALEGTYPPNLEYLTENYGLIYDKNQYYIDYQYIGSNLRPDYTIIERD